MNADFDVQKIARLAKLGLNPEEAERYRHEFSAILEFVAQVRSLPLDNVGAVHSGADSAPMVPDQQRPGLAPEQTFESSPLHRENFFEVPTILPDANDAEGVAP